MRKLFRINVVECLTPGKEGRPAAAEVVFNIENMLHVDV